VTEACTYFEIPNEIVDSITRAEAGTNPPPEDPRPFLIRLLSSIRVMLKPKLKSGRLEIEGEVTGGTDF
jgi:hypothetical protein